MSLTDPDKYINRLRHAFPAVYQAAVDNGTHPVHIAYLLINSDAKVRGTPWIKCLDCGQPYVPGENDSTATFCSPLCEERTARYLEGP